MSRNLVHTGLMQLNERVRHAIDAELAKRGMSRRALARELGWTQTYIQSRMTGRCAFTTHELEQVAGFLEIPVSDLLADTPAEVVS